LYRTLTFLALGVSVTWLVVEPGWPPLVASLAAFAAFFRDDIHGVIGRHVFSLAPKPALVRDLSVCKYSFNSDEFINPGILDDLLGWLSDSGHQVVAVNIAESNRSNRYFGTVTVKPTSRNPLVTKTHESEWVAYQYIGHSFSGLHLVQTWRCGGGSGIFCDILLLTISYDKAIEFTTSGTKKVRRVVLRTMGAIPLGDRYGGDITFRFGILTIPASSGLVEGNSKCRRMLVV